MYPSAGCRQGHHHLPCARGSHLLYSQLPCQRPSERASQVTLGTHCPPRHSRLGLRDHADLSSAPAPIKGPRCLDTGSVQTEQTGSVQRDLVAVLHELAGRSAPAGAASGSLCGGKGCDQGGGRWGISLSSHCFPQPCLSLSRQGGSAPQHDGPPCPWCHSPSGMHRPPSWEMRARHEHREQTQRRSPAQWD